MDSDYNFNALNSLPLPVFCPTCRARRFTLDTPCPSCQRREEVRRASFPLERFQCSRCKCFRPITDFPLDKRDFRATTCSICHTRRRDDYLKQKGEPVSKDGRIWQFKRAQRVVEKALKKRIQREEVWAWAAKALEREEWWQQKGQELWKEAIQRGEGSIGSTGPPEAQEGFAGGTDTWESSVGRTDIWEGPQEAREGSAGGSDAWEGLTDKEESSLDPQDGWGGFPGERESSLGPQDGWKDPQEHCEGSQEAREGFAGRSKAWEDSTDLQDQYCSSCNQKKLLTDFDGFFTCNSCRERNRRAKQARQSKYKAIIAPKATREEIERSLRVGWSRRSEFKLLLNNYTRPATVEDYLNKDS